MKKNSKILSDNYLAVRKDIFAFCKALNFRPTWQQKGLLEIVQRQSPRQRIAVKSGRGPGKTTISGIVGLWWVLKDYNAKVIVTAPTMRQCRKVWLGEVRRTLDRADPWVRKLLKVTATSVKVAGSPDWGIELATATNPESISGYHEKNLKVICEEASGIDRELLEALKQTLSNRQSAMLMIGNPTQRDGLFFDAFSSDRGNWETLTFNAEESPAYVVDPARNKEIEDEFGRDSDYYRYSVLGEFPHSDPNCVVSSEELEKCTDRKLMLPMSRLSDVKQFGLDFARFGGDELVIYRRSGGAIVQWERLVRCDPSMLVGKAFQWQDDAGWRNDQCRFVADAGGMGQGVMHLFYQADKQIHEFNNGGKAVRSDRFANKITEAFFNFAAKVRRGEIYIPNDRILIQQLSTRLYFMNPKGRMILETKDQYMKRGHSSPDRADACVMAFYDHVSAPKGSVVGLR